MEKRVCLNCRELKPATACECRRAYFCSDSCREAGKIHLKVCEDLKTKATSEETTIQVISHWLDSFSKSENNYTQKVQAALPKEGSFFDFVSMAEDEIAFLFTSTLAITRIHLKQMPASLNQIDQKDQMRSNYIELYRLLLFSSVPRAFFELRVLFNSGKLRIFRVELLPPKVEK